MLAVLMALLGTLVSAEPRAEALAILNSAIEAHGGKAALLKAGTFQRSSAGELNLPTGKAKFSDVVVAKLPERLRIVVELERGVRVTTILDGKNGWKGLPGAIVDLPADTVDELREEAYVLWIATLAPLLDEGFTLSPVPSELRDEKVCVGVLVVRKGHYDATLWFDTKSKLLIAIDKEAKEGGLKIRKRYVFGDHKEFGGARLPTVLKESIGDRLITEVTIKNLRLLDRVDESDFKRP